MENVLDEEIPKPLVYILTAAGFDNRIALKNIKPESITGIEDYFNTNFASLTNGLIGTCYENMQPFKIIPGHCAFIESLPHYVDKINVTKQPIISQHSSDFTYILKLLIESAENNSHREAKGRRYDQCLKEFATYIYLMCGRSCYETLSANLPLPQANTICKKMIYLSR